MQSRYAEVDGRTLEEWLSACYVPSTKLLDLSYDRFHWDEHPWYGTVHREDPSYKQFLPEFMRNPNSYLHANPHITGLSLYGQSAWWAPHSNIKNLAANTTLEYLDLGFNNLNVDDIRILATNTNIKVLSLRNSKIGDKAGAMLVNQCRNLKKLNLFGTGIGGETVKALLANKNLISVQLDEMDVCFCNKFKVWRSVRHNAKEQKQLSKSSNTFFPAPLKKKSRDLIDFNPRVNP